MRHDERSGIIEVRADRPAQLVKLPAAVTPRLPGDSACRRAPSARTLENIYRRLDVSSRTAAVTRAFPERDRHPV